MDKDRKRTKRETEERRFDGTDKKRLQSAAVHDQDLIADLSPGLAIHLFLTLRVRQRD